MNNIYESLIQNADISQDVIVSLLELEDFSKVFELADKINFDNFKNKVDIRAILEFSNYCKRKCAYCGLNSNNKNLTRYRISEDEILQVAVETYKAGYKTIVLQSGEDPYFTAKKIGDIVKKDDIIAKIDDVNVIASIDGLLRGLIRDSYRVRKGLKIADIDPRYEEYENCFTISDKARTISGGVLEAILSNM